MLNLAIALQESSQRGHDTRRGPSGKDRSRQRGGRNADEQAIENRAPDVGAVCAHREHRRRMRRQHSVHHRQACHERDPDLDERHAGAARDGEHEWYEQDEPDLEKDGDPDDERDEHDRPTERRSPNRPMT
jgi:hypothetical protein